MLYLESLRPFNIVLNVADRTEKHYHSKSCNFVNNDNQTFKNAEFYFPLAFNKLNHIACHFLSLQNVEQIILNPVPLQ